MEEEKIISTLSKLKINPKNINPNDNLSEISKTIAKEFALTCLCSIAWKGNIVDLEIDGKYYRIIFTDGQTLD